MTFDEAMRYYLEMQSSPAVRKGKKKPKREKTKRFSK
jgi:hypothetical protein